MKNELLDKGIILPSGEIGKDMSTQFNQLAKIIHMYMLTISRFFCIVLLKGGNVYVT